MICSGTLAQCSLPSGYICSYNTIYKSLCPSCYSYDLCLGACGQKVTNGALDLACHVLPRLFLILLLWVVEEYGSSTPSIPATIKVKGAPCVYSMCAGLRVCSCVCNCIVSNFLSTLSYCNPLMQLRVCHPFWFASGQVDISISLLLSGTRVQYNFSCLVQLS